VKENLKERGEMERVWAQHAVGRADSYSWVLPQAQDGSRVRLDLSMVKPDLLGLASSGFSYFTGRALHLS